MLQIGQRLGDFEVVRLLGHGGMGEVYEAQQFDPPRRVALKVLASHLGQSEELLQRFWREAAALAQLDHPGIVRVLTRGRDAGTAYYTMQLIRGISLARLIKEGTSAEPRTGVRPTLSDPSTRSDAAHLPAPEQPPTPPEFACDELVYPYRTDRHGFVVRIGIAAARALSAAHQAGVLHRDLKPGNLMLDRHSHLYIVDFGLARVLNIADGSQAGCVRGTPWYMSPEHANGQAIDERSDVFSLGVTLYELTTGGKGPYSVERGDQDAVFRAARAGEVIPLRSLAPDTPVSLVRIIEKAMQRAMEDRYPSAAAMLADLEQAMGPAPVRDSQSVTPTAVKAVRPSRRRWALAGSIAAILLGGLAALLAFRKPQGGAETTKPDRPARSEGFVQSDRLGEEPLPPLLRARASDHRLALFRDSGDPLYASRIWGQGLVVAERGHVQLHSSTTDPQTLIVIDNDPQLRWFEFEIAMQRVLEANKPVANSELNQLGLFFGFRKNVNDPERDYPFFVLELQDELPQAPAPSRLLVGWARLERPRGPRAPAETWITPLPDGKGSLDLPPAPERNRNRTIQIVALDGEVTITVSGRDQAKAVLTFKLADLKRPGLRNPIPRELDPRGALGIWANNGVGVFRNPTIILRDKRLDD